MEQVQAQKFWPALPTGLGLVGLVAAKTLESGGALEMRLLGAIALALAASHLGARRGTQFLWHPVGPAGSLWRMGKEQVSRTFPILLVLWQVAAWAEERPPLGGLGSLAAPMSLALWAFGFSGLIWIKAPGRRSGGWFLLTLGWCSLAFMPASTLLSAPSEGPGDGTSLWLPYCLQGIGLGLIAWGMLPRWPAWDGRKPEPRTSSKPSS